MTSENTENTGAGPRRAADEPSNDRRNGAEALINAVDKAVRDARASVADGPAGFPFVEGLEPAPALARLTGNVKLYTKSLGLFCQGIPQFAADMAAALEAGDRATLQRLAHTVKGLAATVGAPDVSSAAAHLEHSLNDDGFTPDQALLDALTGRMESLVSAVAASGILTEGQPAPPRAEQAGGDAEAMRTFSRLLEEDDATAPDFFAEHKTAFPLPEDAVQKIEACLRAYDFEEALAILKAAR